MGRAVLRDFVLVAQALIRQIGSALQPAAARDAPLAASSNAADCAVSRRLVGAAPGGHTQKRPHSAAAGKLQQTLPAHRRADGLLC